MKTPEFFIDSTQSDHRFILVDEYDLIYLAEAAERALESDINLMYSSMQKAPGIISGVGFDRVISNLKNTLLEIQDLLNALNACDGSPDLKPLKSLDNL